MRYKRKMKRRAGGESARLPPVCPGFDSRVEFVAGNLLCSERFLFGWSGFHLSSKTNIFKFQFDSGMHGHFWTSSCEHLGSFAYLQNVDCSERQRAQKVLPEEKKENKRHERKKKKRCCAS